MTNKTYEDEPRERVATPFGAYDLISYGAAASLTPGPDGLYLTINGIEITGRVHLRYERHHHYDRQAADAAATAHEDYNAAYVVGWHDDPKSGAWYLKRRNGLEATDGQRAKIREVLIPWAAAWLDAHPDFVRAGYAYQLAGAAAKARAAFDESLKAVEAYRETAAVAQAKVDAFNAGGPAPLPADVCRCGHLRQEHEARKANHTIARSVEIPAWWAPKQGALL